MISLAAPWTPDIADINTATLRTCLNVLPLGNSYGPAYDLATITSALPSACLGCFQARRFDGSYAVFAWTVDKLWLYNQGTDTWTDVSRTSGGAYAVPSGEYGWFIQRGDIVIAGNANDVPQAYTLSSSTNFAGLGGSPPVAGSATIINQQIVLSRQPANPYTVTWSGVSSATSWTSGTDSAGSITFVDGGQVMAVSGRESGYVLQQDAVRRMVFQPTGPVVFSFERIEDARGCSAPFSPINMGGITFYYGNGSFNAIAGTQSKNIGLDRVNETFKRLAQQDQIVSMVGAVDPRQPRVAWAFRSINAVSGVNFDTLLIYDAGRDKFVQVNVNLDYLAFNGLATLGYDLESLDQFGTLDTLPFSLDAAFLQGGVPTFGGFSSTHKLGFFNGAALEATLESSESQLNPPNRAFVSSITIYGAPVGTQVAVGGREVSRADVTTFYRPEQSMGVDGTFPARSSARYHRTKIRVPAGATWPAEGISGMDYNYQNEGGR